jgi:outer membrane immunogenic protein
MKKILLASVALFGFAGAASAADLPMRAAPPAPVIAAAPIFTWTGFYVGVNAGFGWSNDDFDAVDFADEDDDGGFVGGAQVGYNYQIGSFVVGLEGDIQYADFGGELSFDVDDDEDIDEDDFVFDRGDWFGTVRARAGVAFGQALIYGTGGFAFADDATGWTVGGGLEYAFTNNLSAKIEGLYVNLDHGDDDFDIDDFDGETDFGVIRAGLNFRFGTY